MFRCVREREGRNNECFIKALPSGSLRPSANEAEIRSGRWPALFISVCVCLFLSILTSVSDAQQRPAGSGQTSADNHDRRHSVSESVWNRSERIPQRSASNAGVSDERASAANETHIHFNWGVSLLSLAPTRFLSEARVARWHKQHVYKSFQISADTSQLIKLTNVHS